jgi:hypothetical protein
MRTHRPALLVLSLGVLSSLAGACLGQDYKDIELQLWNGDHGWMATVEPDERFGVTLWENPAYPEAPWTLIEHQPAHVTLEGSTVDPYPFGNPAEMPEDEREGVPTEQPAVWIFSFAGRELGESTLAFELLAEGQAIDRAEFTIAVVEDACDGDVGLAAPRCRREPHRVGQYGWTEREHGQRIDLSPGADELVGLVSNSLYPDAAWQVLADDSAAVEVATLGATQSRASGDWDTAGDGKPALFLPIHEFSLTGRSPGESSVAFELVADGRRIGLCEFTVAVAE